MKIKQKNVNFIENIIFIGFYYNAILILYTRNICKILSLFSFSACKWERGKEKKILISFSFVGSFMSVFTIFHTYMYDVLHEYAYLRISVYKHTTHDDTNNSKI